MMVIILEETFDNGNKLQLLFTQGRYPLGNVFSQLDLAPSTLVNHYTLQFCEKNDSGLHVVQKEFFHLAEYKAAISAFSIRKTSKNPQQALNLGRSIEGIAALGIKGPSVESFKVFNDEKVSNAE